MVGEATSIAPRAHLDMLHAVRRCVRNRWPDAKLTTVEKRLFDFHRQDDIPGHLIPAVWLDWLREGESETLAAVLEHNHHDLLTLALLPERLFREHHAPSHRGIDATAAARELHRRGRLEEALVHLLDHTASLDADGRHLLAGFARRAGRLDIALDQWRALAEEDDVSALEALAKHCEHQEKDLRWALRWTERLLEINADRHDAHLHRAARLKRRLARRPDATS